ncbi:ABC transporter ATP-binding protein/permease (plasmid) [Deinococcus sp. KNUC1210]|uniref:ABC transporter ATP-binding protein n=1 Tax=Deinococcus sp. KNUC1210 TaxID=2917691 RepID=UPI001EF11F09|nr:ABC transporter ATP-binding protein [Deinococcus sp. KNUC1210]ULH13980.1 ABC transporter ATP-binding protein/permease [Deinococcus sp. KNUC1210]
MTAFPQIKGHAVHARFLGTYFAPQRRWIVQLTLLVLGSIALQLAAPWIFGRFVDAARSGGTTAELARFGLDFIGVTLVLQLLNVLTGILASRMGWQATNALRLDLTAHCLGLGQDFHKRHTPGELIERVDGDAGILSAFFSRLAVDLFGNALLLLGVTLLLLRLDWRIGLSAALFAALSLWVLSRVRQLSRSAWSGVRDVTTRTFGLIGEALSGIEDLRANGAIPYVMRRFFALLREWRPLQQRALLTFGAAWALPLLVFACGDAMAFVLSARLHATGTLTLGAASTVFFYIALMARPIDAIRVQLQNLQRVDASLTRVETLMAERPTLLDAGRQPMPDGPLSVAFDDVTFSYDTQPVIQGMSVQIGAGRTVGLLGRTGSGKTTVSRLLFRLYDPQTGEIRLGGVPVRDLPLELLRSRIGLVTQDVQLFTASVRDNLSFFDPGVSDDRLWEALETAGMAGWCHQLPDGLDALLHPSALSSGEAQLLALARLALKDPHLIILDEASSRLDRATETALDRSLAQVLAGRTAIIIAHRLATVARVDDILILSEGRVREFGPRLLLEADPNSQFSALLRAGLEEVLA